MRVEADGEAVVAGHATPRAKVELRDGARVLASVAADNSGQFVIVPEPLSAGTHRLRLAARVGNGQPQLSAVAEVEVATPNVGSPSPVAAANPSQAKPGSVAPTATLAAANAVQPVASGALAPKPSISLPLPTPLPAPSVAAANAAQPVASSALAPKPPIPLSVPSPLPQPPVVVPIAAPAATSAVRPIASTTLAPKPSISSPVSSPSPQPSIVVAAVAPETNSKADLAPGPVSTGGSRLAVSRVKATEPGRLEAEGYAEPGTRLRLTLNGAYLAEVAAGADGLWSLTIEHGMTAGLYTLEAQRLDPPRGLRAEASFAYPQNPTPSVAALASAAPRAEPPIEALEPSPEPSPAPAIVQATPREPPQAPQLAASAAIPAAPPTPSLPAPKSPEATPIFAASAQPAPIEPATAPPTAGVPPAASPPPLIVAASTPTPGPTFSTPSHAIVAEVRTTTVVRGDNLWDLARQFYGDGLRYADIYSANAAQIRNPNLIYIGQVFVVPQNAPPRVSE